MLLSFVVAELRSRGSSDIYLWVLGDNQQARNFYERSDFVFNGDKMTVNIGGKELIEVRYVYNVPALSK